MANDRRFIRLRDSLGTSLGGGGGFYFINRIEKL